MATFVLGTLAGRAFAVGGARAAAVYPPVSVGATRWLLDEDTRLLMLKAPFL